MPLRQSDPQYEARSLLNFFGHPIESVGVRDDVVAGFMSRLQMDQTSWSRPPHLAFVNLPTYDANNKLDMKPTPRLRLEPREVERFVREYGPLYEKDLPEQFRASYDGTKPVGDLSFRERLSEFASSQLLLRQAWAGDHSVRSDIESQMQQGFQVNMRGIGELFVSTDDLWKFICLLFLLDDAADRPGVCANRDCPAPYFIKERRTQRFCKKEACIAYAARLYTKKWWDTGGKEQRAKVRAKGKRKR